MTQHINLPQRPGCRTSPCYQKSHLLSGHTQFLNLKLTHDESYFERANVRWRSSRSGKCPLTCDDVRLQWQGGWPVLSRAVGAHWDQLKVSIAYISTFLNNFMSTILWSMLGNHAIVSFSENITTAFDVCKGVNQATSQGAEISLQ